MRDVQFKIPHLLSFIFHQYCSGSLWLFLRRKQLREQVALRERVSEVLHERFPVLNPDLPAAF